MAPYFPPAGTSGAAVTDASVQPIISGSKASGRDGDAVFDGTNDVVFCSRVGLVYTALRIGVPRDFYVAPGVTFKPAGFPTWCSGDVLIDGTVDCNGNDAAGAVAGTATAAGTFPATTAGGAGGAGGADNNGAQGGNANVETPNSGRWNGAPGGNAAVATGGVTASISAVSVTRGTTHGMAPAMGLGTYLSQLGTTAEACGGGGSGGGGHASGAGGGGGASGHMWELAARSLVVSATGVIRANGGKGANAVGASAGAGSGGAGGRLRFDCGTVTLADPILSIQVRGGESGAGGAVAGSYGNCGEPGEIMYLSGKPSPMATRHSRVNLTAAELAAAISVGGVLDISGSFIVGSDAGRATGVANTSTGGSSFALFVLQTADGPASLRFNASTFAFDLAVRGGTVISTQDINAIATAAPCMQPFVVGDQLDWRVRYDPSGGPRSMMIRLFCNRTGGFDEVGVASGAPLAVATSGYAVSSSTTPSSWGPAPSYILATHTANVVGTVAIFGDSIVAVRKNSIGWDGVSVGSRSGWATQVCISFARQGAQWADQTTAWQASPMRGAAGVVAVVAQLGHNDINAGSSAAVVTASAQTFFDDVAANNPNAKRIISKLSPSYSVQQSSGHAAIWDAVQANYDGTGGTPVTGVAARATAHVATMGDVNKSLRSRCEVNDYTHPNFWGRALNARSIGAAYDSTGLAR